MPKAAIIFVHAIERFTYGIGRVCWWLVLGLITILLIEAGMRYGFNQPQVWSLEMSEFIFGAYFLFGGAYAFMYERHVRMDAIYSRWSKRTKAIVDAITFSAVITYLIVYFLGGIHNVLFSWRFNMVSQSAWGPPMTPIRIIVETAGVFMILIAVTRFIRDIGIIRGKELPRQIEWSSALFKGKL